MMKIIKNKQNKKQCTKIFNKPFSDIPSEINLKDYSSILNNIFDKIYCSRQNSTNHYAAFFGHGKKPIIGINYLIPNRISVHAEVDALKRTNKWISIGKEKFNMLVIRLSKTGHVGESRPCYHCILHLQKYCNNIKFIYYSTCDGKIVRERLDSMLYSNKTHISYGNCQRLMNIQYS